jgi:hypothetical protein
MTVPLWQFWEKSIGDKPLASRSVASSVGRWSCAAQIWRTMATTFDQRLGGYQVTYKRPPVRQ